MGDHPNADNEEVFEAKCAVKMGDVVVVASQKVNVSRSAQSENDRKTIERGNIVVDVNQTESADTLYNAV